MSKTIGLQGMFFESENQDSNSTFYEVAIRVHGLGKNANGSDITNSAYENAVSTIKGIPIVAKFTEEVDSYGNDGDLTAHNQMIVKDNRTGGYVVKYDTVPLGFVHPEANITTEDVEESDGRIRTYIKADKVILWKRYEATQKIIEWLDSGIVPKVSMEIGNVNGQVSDGYFQIDSFEYESICALGSDVMPCFDKADIMQFESKDFNKLYQEMINEYEKGGEEIVSEVKDKSQVEEVIETEINESVAEETPVIEDEAKEVIEENKIVEENFKEEPQEITKEDNSLKELEEKFESLSKEFEELKKINSELMEYKLNKEKEELRNEVDAKANEFEFKEDEIKELKEQAYNAEISVADFEKELFALMGRKALEAKKEFSLQNTKEEKAKVKVSSSGEEAKVDELSKKYGKYAKYIPKNK